MHRGILSSLLVASCALAACAHAPVTTARSDMVWSLQQKPGEEAALRFGTPRGEATLLALSCQPHSGDIDITVTAPSDRMTLVALASSARRRRYIMEPARSAKDDPLLLGATKTSDPVMTRFAETGDLMLFNAGRGQMLPMDQDKAAKFLATCRR